MSDSKSPIGSPPPKPTPEVIEDSKTKLNAYWEVLKIKQKKYKQAPSIDRLKKMMTQRQFDMLNIKQ
jgi:hypothetical protein